MKKLHYVLFILNILLLVSFISIKSYFKINYSGSTALPNISEEVIIKYDDFGIPHIYAKNDLDAYQSLGYIHAKDRLFQMDLMRRVGSGCLAELLGKELVDVDIFFRTLGLSAHAKASTQAMLKDTNEKYLKLAQAYIEGINLFIEENKLPLEYTLLGDKPKKFNLNDVNFIAGYMSFTFAMAIKTEPLVSFMERNLGENYLNDLALHTLPHQTRIPVNYPKKDSLAIKLNKMAVPKGVATILEKMPVPLFKGSNAWIVSGEKTESGFPIFCNDTHIGFSSPSVWYESHIEYPGFSFYGNYLPGFPFALIGHSKYHSFGLTMFENDDFDFYEESYNGLNKNEIIFRGEPKAINRRLDTINIKGSAEPKVIEIKSTHHGNIVNEVISEISAITKNPVAAWWVFLVEPSKAVKATFGLNYATDLNSFEQAVSLIHAPGLNVMYADNKNNIAWWAAAKLAKRPKHIDSKRFLEGSTGKDEIEGWYHFTENPKSINPPSGFVFSANNQPDTMPNGELYPGHYYPGYRALRILNLLEAESNWTQEKMKVLQLDSYTMQHKENLEIFIKALPNEIINENAQIIDFLRKWDGTHKVEEIAPSFYYRWAYNTLSLMMTDELGSEWFDLFLQTFLRNRSMTKLFENEQSVWWNNINTNVSESRAEIITAAFNKSLDEISQNLGGDYNNWQWGKVTRLTHHHALGTKKPLNLIFDVKTSKVEANDGALNKLEFLLSSDGFYQVKSGPAMRIIVDLGNIEKSESILPTGQSGNLFSPFYKNQAEMFVNGAYRAQLMNKKEIEDKTSNQFLILPK